MSTAEPLTAYGILVDSPEALRSYLPNCIAFFGSVDGAPLLQITLPCCGATKAYEQPEDIPRENVGPCKCGNWFIYYRNSQQSVSVEEMRT
jgi:hypothetical protein